MPSDIQYWYKNKGATTTHNWTEIMNAILLNSNNQSECKTLWPIRIDVTITKDNKQAQHNRFHIIVTQSLLQERTRLLFSEKCIAQNRLEVFCHGLGMGKLRAGVIAAQRGILWDIRNSPSEYHIIEGD